MISHAYKYYLLNVIRKVGIFSTSPSDFEADDEDNQDYDSLTMSDSTLSLAQPSGVVIGGTGTKVPASISTSGGGSNTSHHHYSGGSCHYPHHHHHRPLPHTSSKHDLLKQSGHPPTLMRGNTYCSGMCSRGGFVTPAATNAAPLQFTANRPNNGRPATPSSESNEEVSKLLTFSELCLVHPRFFVSLKWDIRIIRFHYKPCPT